MTTGASSVSVTGTELPFASVAHGAGSTKTGSPAALRNRRSPFGNHSWVTPGAFAESEGTITTYGYGDRVLLPAEATVERYFRRLRANMDRFLGGPATLSVNGSVGGYGGGGVLPFAGTKFAGEIALFRFNNYAIDGAEVLARYFAVRPPPGRRRVTGSGRGALPDAVPH